MGNQLRLIFHGWAHWSNCGDGHDGIWVYFLQSTRTWNTSSLMDYLWCTPQQVIHYVHVSMMAIQYGRPSYTLIAPGWMHGGCLWKGQVSFPIATQVAQYEIAVFEAHFYTTYGIVWDVLLDIDESLLHAFLPPCHILPTRRLCKEFAMIAPLPQTHAWWFNLVCGDYLFAKTDALASHVSILLFPLCFLARPKGSFCRLPLYADINALQLSFVFLTLTSKPVLSVRNMFCWQNTMSYFGIIN